MPKLLDAARMRGIAGDEPHIEEMESGKGAGEGSARIVAGDGRRPGQDLPEMKKRELSLQRGRFRLR
jgi:hypothetical protein